jgi:uncharacterized protein (TIGR03083 family)
MRTVCSSSTLSGNNAHRRSEGWKEGRMADYTALLWDEVADIGLLLHQLGDEEWDSPSLCAGWRVRDVIGHMLYGHTTPFRRVVAGALRFRGDVHKTSLTVSKELADTCSPAQLRQRWDRELIAEHARRGLGRVVRTPDGFLDHLIHHQDIRRPLGRPRAVPEGRLLAALELVPRTHTPIFGTRNKVRGLKLEATDVGWSAGDGPLVAGSGEAIVLAAAGRPAALADLTGDGVAVLAERTA